MKSLFHDSAWKRQVRRKLLAWYRVHKRDLPWRRTRNPYHVWISEIMLQQTQVATVIPYFYRFLAAFPNLEQLAAAPEAQVLKLWEGLGYYRRARQLHRAASEVVTRHQGIFPTTVDGLRELPGIGRYTAGAILSIASDCRVPILEANTIRLFSRLMALAVDPASRDGQRSLWNFAEEILPNKGVGEFNQALMEFGSLVCKPRDPDCLACPLIRHCPAFAGGKQAAIPVAKKAKNYELSHEACVAVRRRRQVLLRHCGEGERWSGLWDFPRFPLVKGKDLREQLAAGVQRMCGVSIGSARQLTTIKHGVTRYRITLDCYEAPWEQGNRGGRGQRWVQLHELNDLALSMPARRFSSLLQESATPATSRR